MKYLLIILIGFLSMPVLAEKIVSQQQIEIQRKALDDMLAEELISQYDYSHFIDKLDHKALIASLNKQSVSVTKSTVDGPVGTASLSGTVRLTGVGVNNAYVELREINTGSYYAQTNTDAMGNYTFPDLVAGDYFVSVESFFDEYLNVIWSAFGTEMCERFCTADADNTISLGDGVVFVDVDLDVQVGGSVSGIISSSGAPVDGTYVTISDSLSNYSVGAQTDAMGFYTASGLPAGNYYVSAIDGSDIYIDAIWSTMGTETCLNCQPDADNLFSVALGVTAAGKDFDLIEGASLTGEITDAITTAAIETLDVALYGAIENVFAGNYKTQFDGAGNYTISGVPEGDYYAYLTPQFDSDNDYVPEIYNNIPCNLCANMISNGAGDLLTLINGATTSGIDFALNTGASISGTILNATYPAETVEQTGLVYVFNETNRLIATRFLNGTDFVPTFDGSYKIGGLLPGTYFVQGGDLGREFFQRELYDNIRCPWSGCDRGAGGAAVVLGANEQRLGIDFNLEYGGKISGTVTDAVSGMPISNAVNNYVQFYDDAGLVAGGAGIRADGTYTSQRALPPGTYSVRTGSMFGGWFSAPYVMQKYDPMGNIDCPGVTCDLTTGIVDVPAYTRQIPRDPIAEAAAATVTGIDFALSEAFSFSGIITELGSSDPLADVHVLVYDVNGNFATWATTDALGDFTVSGLPAGTYYALTNNGSNLPLMGFFPKEVGGWIDILFDGMPCPGSACDVTDGTQIVLGPGPIASDGSVGLNLNISLSAGGSITGQVNTFGTTLPAKYVDINVYNGNGDFYGSYPSDDSGYYMTVGFPEGTYYLTTSNDGALVNAKYGDDYCFEDSCNPIDAVPVVITGSLSVTDADFTLRTDYLFKNSLE